MAAGDVTVEIFDINTTTISGAIAAMRVTANDKWLMTNLSNGQQVLVAHVEET